MGTIAADPEAPQRIARLTPLADVLARVDAGVAQVAPREVKLVSAVGRVLAGDVSVILHPRLTLALRDGYAVSADLTTDASSYAPVPLPAATRIDVGESMPAGTDAVAPFETVTFHGGGAEIIAPVAAGDGVLPAGMDANRQITLLRQGVRLTRRQAAVLAAVSTSQVLIREPRVHLVSARRAGDAVIDAAMDMIAGEITAAGGRVRRDSPDDMPLDDALKDETADAVIVIGGTGGGRHDRSVRTLARAGRVEAHGIAISPGETSAFGFVGSRPVLLLPGRIDAALAVWLLLGRRMLAQLAGCIEREPVSSARLTRKITSSLGLTEVVPVRLQDGGAEPIALGYLPLSSLAQADGWILIPADSEGYPPGAEVVIRAWP
jgi:molybdopterin biosynthesis enzyme